MDEHNDISNLGYFLDEQAQKHPEQEAIIIAGKKGSSGRFEINYKDLADLTRAYAAGLSRDGVAKGTRVLVMITPSVDLIAVTWALFRCGAVPILMDPGMGIKMLIRCIRRTKPEVLIGIPRAHILSITFKRSFSSLKKRITVGPKLSWGGSSTREYRKLNLDWPQDEAMNPEDLSAILFTSGSTGAPKGVQYEFRHFLAQVKLLKNSFNISEGGVDLPLLPVFALFNPALGMTSVIPRVHPAKPAKLDAAHILELIEKFNINHSFGAPVLWQKIIRHARDSQTQLPQLEQILIAGADVPPRLIELIKEWAPNAQVLTPYGATECLPLTMIDGETLLDPNKKEMSEAGQGNCVGRAVEGVQLKIIPAQDDNIEDLEDILECRAGEVGEILASGPVVTRNYDQMPEETALAKVESDGVLWHRMGDVGYLDQEGYLWYCGRQAHLVDTSRGDLYSVCAEAIFNQHPNVYRSALIRLGGKPPYVPAIVVELERGCKIEPATLSIELQKLGASQKSTKSIRNFYIHPSFPVDVRHNAKIHRLKLGKWAAKQEPLPSV